MTPTKCRSTIVKKPYGRIKCVLEVCHRGDHMAASGFSWKNRGVRTKRYGLTIKITEWKELRRRIERVCENGLHPIPDSPPWPPGTDGANIQKLRKLARELNARFEKKE